MRRRGFRTTTKAKKPFLLKLIIFLIILWACSGTYLYYFANKNLQTNNLQKVATNVTWLKKIFYRHSNIKEMENLLLLCNLKPIINKESGKLSPETYKAVCLNYLKNHKNLDGFHDLYNYINNKGINIPFVKGLFLFDKGDFENAKQYLKDTKPFDIIYQTNRIPIIKDILFYDLKEKKFIAKINGTDFLKNEFSTNRHFLKFYNSTIDKSLQKKAGSVLSKFDGAVLLSENNQLKICFGKNFNIFAEYFEPGSVIKLITATALLTENPTLMKYPYICNKPLSFSGKIFYDWQRHGKLQSIEEALACSCNLFFGEAGVKLGGEVMSEYYKKFYIDKNITVNLEEFIVNLGKKRKDFDNAYNLADGSIGLNIPEINSYWLIKTASTIENEGKNVFPELFSSYSLLGMSETTKIEPTIGNTLIKPTVLSTIRKGMNKTVTWKRGTGKKANIEGIDIYLKTGTAGNKPFLNSILLGYFLKNNKTYSFGIYLKEGGNERINGAKALKELISIL